MMNNTPGVLVIDDEPDIRELITLTLSRMGIASETAGSVHEGIRCIDKGEFFLVLTDMRLPDGDGNEVLRYIQNTKPQLPVAVITAYGNVEGAVSSLKAGAFDYVAKPVDLAVLKALVNTALCLYQRTPNAYGELLLGESESIRQLRESIHKVARSQAPIFIYGESGVGKELVARLIHANGPRADKPFIPVNCAAIPTELMESEFFGHKKGSFTGAYADKQGLFVAAQGGTLFLDEIADLPLAMQVKLLRVVQEKAVKPVGEWSESPIDVRILSASNKNLLEEISAGRFRQELYYRINVIELKVSSLKERASDVPLLAKHILARLTSEHGSRSLTISPAAIKALEAYPFPGNVRELENILERAVALCGSEVIQIQDLQLPTTPPVFNDEEVIQKNLDNSLQSHEKDLILDALEKTKWNRTAAAKLLGISFRTLRYRLKKLGIE